jgi:hypothetical protein
MTLHTSDRHCEALQSRHCEARSNLQKLHAVLFHWDIFVIIITPLRGYVLNLLFENGLCLPGGSNFTKENSQTVVENISGV